ATRCPRRARFRAVRTRRYAAMPIRPAAGCAPRHSRRRPRGVGLPPSRQTRPSGHIGPARRITRRAQPRAEDTSLGTPVRHKCRQLPILPGLFLAGGDPGMAPAAAFSSRGKGDGRNELEAALTRLTARGALIELKSGQYVVTTRTREFAVGRLNLHRDGYGFLISERPIPGINGDIFISPEAAEKAMHGDRVIVRIARIEAGGRADGDIVKVLKRAHPTVVGEFRIGRRGCYVVPADSRIHQWIEIPDGMELPPAGAAAVDRIGVTAPKVDTVAELEGMVVNVELLEYPERGASPVGRVVEILGHPDDFGVDVEIIIRKHHLPHQFPPEVIEQAQAMPARVAEADIEGRRDFRDMPIVTIDGETARDFDDAVWVGRLPNGNFAL